MAFSKLAGTLAITTANAAGTEIGAETLPDLSKFDWLSFAATLTGLTGGTLDVYIQREIATNVWADWLHFPQLAAGAAAISYGAVPEASAVISTIGIGTTAAPGVVLAANTCVGGHPGKNIRAVYVSGAGTAAGAAQVIYVSGWCAK